MVLILIYSSLKVTSCPHHHQNPQRIIKRLFRRYMFVENPYPSQVHLSVIPKRVSRQITLQTQSSTMCPWSWSHDDNPDRVPRFLIKAVCPDCKHFCRAVLYNYKGLMQRCDVRIGRAVWKWTLFELPVAFVFDP